MIVCEVYMSDLGYVEFRERQGVIAVTLTSSFRYTSSLAVRGPGFLKKI